MFFFEAMDLYRTFDLKFNPMDSSHFQNNFKRRINCPTTRANMNEPSKRMIYWRYSGDSRMKKVGGTVGPRKKVGGQRMVGANVNVSPVWWFSTV